MARTTATRAAAAASSSSAKRSKRRPTTPVVKENGHDSGSDGAGSSHANVTAADPKKQVEQERLALKKEEAILGIENALKKFTCSLCKRHVEYHRIRPIKELRNGEKTHAKSSRKTEFKAKLKQTASAKKRVAGKRGFVISDDESESDVSTTDDEDDLDSVANNAEDRDSAMDNILSLDDTISEAAGIKAGCIELLDQAPASSRKKHSTVNFSTNPTCGHIFCSDCRLKDGKLFKETGKKVNITCPATTLGRPCGAPLSRTEIQNPNADANAREVQLYMHMKRTLFELRRLDVRQAGCMDKICQLLESKPHANASETPSEAGSPTSSASYTVYRRRATNMSAISSATINNNIPGKKYSSWKTSRNPLKQILYKLRATLFPKVHKPTGASASVVDAAQQPVAEETVHDDVERNKRDRTATASSTDSATVAETVGENSNRDQVFPRESTRARSTVRSMPSRAKVQPPSAKKLKLNADKFADAENDDDTLEPAAPLNPELKHQDRRRSGRRRTAVMPLMYEKQKEQRKPKAVSSTSKSSRRMTAASSASPDFDSSRISAADVTIYDVPPDDSDNDNNKSEFDADEIDLHADADIKDGEEKIRADLSVSPESVRSLNIKRPKRTVAPQRRNRRRAILYPAARDNVLRESSSGSNDTVKQRRCLDKYRFCVSKNRSKKPPAFIKGSKGKSKGRTAPPRSRRPVAVKTKIEDEEKKLKASDDKPQLHFGFNQLDAAAGAESNETDKRISNKSAVSSEGSLDNSLMKSLNRGLHALNVENSMMDADAVDADDDVVIMNSVLNDDKKPQLPTNADVVLPGLPEEGNEEADVAVVEARERAREAQKHRKDRKHLKKMLDKCLLVPPPPRDDAVSQNTPEVSVHSPTPRKTVPSQFSHAAPPVSSQASSDTAANTLFSVNDRTAASAAVHTIITQSSQGTSEQTGPTMAVAGVVDDDGFDIIDIDDDRYPVTRGRTDQNLDSSMEEAANVRDAEKIPRPSNAAVETASAVPPEQQGGTSQDTDSVDLSMLSELNAPAVFADIPDSNEMRTETIAEPEAVDTGDKAVDADVPDNLPSTQPANLARRTSMVRRSSRMMPPESSLHASAMRTGAADIHTPKPHSTPIADPLRGGSRHPALNLDISPIQHISPVASSAPAVPPSETDAVGGANAAAFCFNSAAVRQVVGVAPGLHAKRRPSQFAAATGENVVGDALNFDPEPPPTNGEPAPQPNHQFPDEDLSGNNLNITHRTRARRAAAAARVTNANKQPKNDNIARKVMTQQAYSAAAAAAAAAAAVEEPPLPPVKFDFGPEQLRRAPRAIDLDDLVAFGGSDNLTEVYRAKQRRLQLENGGRPRNTRDFVLCSTGVNTAQQLAAIKKFTRDILHAKYDRNFTRATTHLIVMCDEKGECPRTLKYLQCIAQQKYCVSYEWVENALNAAKNPKNAAEIGGDWLDEFRFLPRGDNTMQYSTPCDAPRRAVALDTKPLSRVLVYFGVHKPDDTKTDADWDREIVLGITRRNYLELLEDMGAQVMLEYKQFSRTASSKSVQFEHKAWIVESYNEKEATACTLLGTHYIDISWLLECISTFSLLRFEAYRPSPPEADGVDGHTFDIDDEEAEQVGDGRA